MNKAILGLLLSGALFALSGCKSGKTQSKYQQCLSAQKTYIKADKESTRAMYKKNTAAKKDKAAAEKMHKKAAAAASKARKALKAFNVENYALSSGDFCKWNVLCVAAREEWEKATAAAEKKNLSKKEKEAADKALEKAEEKYESFNPLGLMGEHNLCD